MAGVLYLVATPIGNLGDISARALETLGAADFIAAEDTRVTLKLLNRFGIKKPLVSYYEHNRAESGEKILSRVLAGETCALVTDAGMPAVSDPGEELVAMCAEAGIEVLVIPGACAAVSALALSALPTGRFTFEGFLSTSRRSRFEHLESLKGETRTMIFYEAPHKLTRTLADMLQVLGDRRVSLSRVLTKIHEETIRETLSEALARYADAAPRGEFVLVIEGAPRRVEVITPETAIDAARRYIEEGKSVKDAVRLAADETGFPKNALYDAIVKKTTDY
jgi:16S rRNA (cytidine1402-2'-O)-methyltransferase